MTTLPYACAAAPIDRFPWVPPVVVQDAWTWLVDQGRVDRLRTISVDLDTLTEAQSDEVDDVLRRVRRNEVAAWLTMTGLAGTVVTLAGPPPPGCRWALVPTDALPRHIAHSQDIATISGCAEAVLAAVAAGHPPPRIPNLGGNAVCRAVILLMEAVHRLHRLQPAVTPQRSSRATAP